MNQTTHLSMVNRRQVMGRGLLVDAAWDVALILLQVIVQLMGVDMGGGGRLLLAGMQVTTTEEDAERKVYL
jgi:hypothetical protein